jgi:hypothetical protein
MKFWELLKEKKIQVFSMLLVYLSIVLWLGGIIFFGFGVASQIFKLSPSRDIAGMLNRAFLQRLNIIEFVSSVLLVGGIILYNFRFKTFFYKAPLFLAVICITILCIYSLIITPQMNDLLVKIPSFENLSDTALKAQFNTYHTMYSTLVRINLSLLFIIFIWQTLVYAAGESLKQITKNDSY